jgi:DNA-binding response OmpR family regulator
MINIAIIEDEIVAANYLKQMLLEDSDIEVVSISKSASEALKSFKNKKIDIAFVDIKLKGDISGLDLALELKFLYENLEIIFITAYSNNFNIQKAIEADAVAFLTKPYRHDEVIAALKIAKKKFINEHKKIGKLFLIEDFNFDFKNKKLYKNNQEIELSENELKLIRILCQNSQITVEKETLQRVLNISDEALRALIYRVRKLTSKKLIKSVKRLGYKISTL